MPKFEQKLTYIYMYIIFIQLQPHNNLFATKAFVFNDIILHDCSYPIPPPP